MNAALGANVVGIDVGGALAAVTGAETRVIHLTIANPVGGAGPWNVDRFTFPAGARSHEGPLSGPLELVAFDAGDGAATIPNDALLRLRSVNVPAAAPAVAGLVRDSDTTFTRPAADPTLRAGDLLAVSGASTAVVCLADLAVTVTLDRIVGTRDDAVARVCSLVDGERTYDVVRVDGTVRLTGTSVGARPPALLPDWVAGDVVRTTVGGTAQEWVLSGSPDGGRLTLQAGPARSRAPRATPAPCCGWRPHGRRCARAVTDPPRTSQVLAPVAEPGRAPRTPAGLAAPVDHRHRGDPALTRSASPRSASTSAARSSSPGRP